MVYPKNKPWITKPVLEALKRRDKCHRRWKKHRNVVNEGKYRQARHEANVCKYQAKMEHDRITAEKLQNPATSNKEYWRLTKLVYGNKVKGGIPSIIDGDENYIGFFEKGKSFQ